MRLVVPFFFAIPSNRNPSDLSQLIALSAHKSRDAWVLEVGKNAMHVFEVATNVNGVGGVQSTSPSGKWNLYLALPDDRQFGQKAFRFLGRFSRSPQNESGALRRMLGPYSPKQLSEIVPSVFKKSLFHPGADDTKPARLPWCFMGQDPERLFAVDYRPSGSDIDDDVGVDDEYILGGG